MRTINSDVEFIYFADSGQGFLAGPYTYKYNPLGKKAVVRKFRLIEVPLDEPKTKLDDKHVLFNKTIDGVNILITNGPVPDNIIFNAHVWVENMKLKKNHSGFDDAEMEKEFCGQLYLIKEKYKNK